jgi:prepilin-type N-terminal cleavage/methylation domain-containing protein/prepilin-type processing-associated H-X9-DG protein
MSRQRSTDSRKAFTLLELMLVVFIVAILAALLLPVLSKAKGRAKQIDCLSQLRQVGLAFQVFAHDHGERFPFQVPVKDEGTLELVQAASALGGDVQFAFRHLQALSNDLVLPKLLACPADSRTNATFFSQLRNDNVSYFVAVTAEPARPDSVLAGDRNIIARDGTSGSILRIGGATEVVWSGACHEFRGNLLFAGGHVERTGNAGLQVAMRSATGPVSAWLPVASSSGSVSSSPGGGATGAASGGNAGGANPGTGNAGKNGAGASGFTALQKFFTPPTPSSQPPPESSPSGPVVPVTPPVTRVPQPPPVPPVAPPPEPKPAAKQMAEANAPAPVAATEPVAAPTTEVSTEPTPSVLLIFLEPDRCWWCWALFLLICVAVSVTLGVLIQRRKEKHARKVSQVGGSTAASI